MNPFLITNGIAAQPEGERLFSVRLVDSRTGKVPCLNGIPFSVLTRAPRAAAASFMRGRNRRLRNTDVEPVGPN